MLTETTQQHSKAYLAHHANCRYCCAAGNSGGQQQRCAEGLQLWNNYRRAFAAQERKK